MRCVKQGYSAIKLHQRDMESVNVVRQAIGPEIVLMIDVNGAWTPRESIEKARKLEEYGVLWLEEPVSPMDDYDGLAYVRDKSDFALVPVWRQTYISASVTREVNRLRSTPKFRRHLLCNRT